MDGDIGWFSRHAASLDSSANDADAVLGQLASIGLFEIGVPRVLGGSGGTTGDALEAIANVAEHSLTAAFVFWGHRTFIEYLLQTPNEILRESWLPLLLQGRFAGATGLSNAMKFLSGIEALQVSASPRGADWRLNGRLPWVTNLRKAGFIVAAAAARDNKAAPAIVAITNDMSGVTRSEDLNLIALRGGNTAAITIDNAIIGSEQILHENAREFCPLVRPAFLGLQIGLSIGLGRIALRKAREHSHGAHSILLPRVDALSAELEGIAGNIHEGLAGNRFIDEPSALFRIRIRLAEIVQTALGLELDAVGGRAYLHDQSGGFERRWREGAFIPVITPSLTQLQGELARHTACHRQ
ncbi:acyl-CoA dehydrogenase family protein [Candidatus Methylospira mobilis]|uniref:acyl-CoA dehydrogenase family protein n=1 Tax=Candidatus Methylospira mobilis TaxID=1808979 RepID=UPI0028E6375F|nr:acyl-CoA dehydrogenase family protein [Candidatus Methylospira mobilis]WNV06398.1 acyl-CoA dehydrogenase family protein [Candidatus Methylospira mobilis]